MSSFSSICACAEGPPLRRGSSAADGLMSSYLRALVLLQEFLILAGAAQAAPYPEPAHGDFVIHDLRFAGGEVLPELKPH